MTHGKSEANWIVIFFNYIMNDLIGSLPKRLIRIFNIHKTSDNQPAKF